MKNGLVKNAKTIKEFSIEILHDSLLNLKYDTLSMSITEYDSMGRKVFKHQKYFYIKEENITSYIYKNDKLLKEETTMIPDHTTFSINYDYKDTLLVSSKAEAYFDNFQVFQRGIFSYNSNNKLLEAKLVQIHIDTLSKDTTYNYRETQKFNTMGFVVENQLEYLHDSTYNRRYKTYRKCNGIIKRLEEFNGNDSLLATITYEYIFDDSGNWIEFKSYEDGKLVNINTRNIQY